MAGTVRLPPIKSVLDIRIVGLDIDKTRKINGSCAAYQVYFKLSESPSVIWRDIFGREWNDLNSAEEASIDGRFLIARCRLLDVVAIHLPELKKVVDATNAACKRSFQEQSAEQEKPDNGWMPAS